MNKKISKVLTKSFAAAFALTISACSVFGGTAAAAASPKHEFANGWSGDTKNHWHASTCGHNIVSEMAAHTFESGKCTVCNEPEPTPTVPRHEHEYASSWTKDGVNHWHASTCGHAIVKDIAPHTFESGKCTVCNEPEPAAEEHKHTYSAEYSFDEVNHWFASDCGHDIVKGMSAHTLKGGVCTACGYEDEQLKPSDAITAYGGYNESLYCEWTASSVDGVEAYYKLSGGSWTQIDGELIRMKNATTARLDAVGLKAGAYSVKIVDGDATYTANDIDVTAYDRSGYAHFGAAAGVGAYNNDGTPKSGAQIVYVTEATKNTVKAKIGGKDYTGIAAILGAASKSDNPLIVRVIGRVAAATWKEGNVTYPKPDSGKTLPASAIVGKNGKQLPTTSSELTQEKLIAGGYNELDTSKYSVLNGLDSKATYKDGAYDSAWNNCKISGAENVTLEGVGTDAEIFQWGFTWANSNSIEIRNLTFDDYTEDACSFEGGTDSTTFDGFESKRIWLHNCTFNQGINYWDVSDEQDKHEGDGATDFKKLSYLSVSYNRYYNNHKTGLIGGSDSQKTANVTFHHNFYDRCQSRLPLGRQANMHMYNNYYYKSTGTNMSLRAGAYAFIEYCYFDEANYPVSTQDGDGKKGVAKLFGCKVVGSGTKALDTNKYNVTVVTDRTKAVANDNIFDKNFDTNPSVFYYDAVGKKTDVTHFITDVEAVKTQIPKLAGVNK